MELVGDLWRGQGDPGGYTVVKGVSGVGVGVV